MIHPREVQFLRAGTGVTHSEHNHSKVERVHFLQIWILPDTQGLEPSNGQLAFDREAARRGLVLLASKDGRNGSLQVHQDRPPVNARGRQDIERQDLTDGRL